MNRGEERKQSQFGHESFLSPDQARAEFEDVDFGRTDWKSSGSPLGASAGSHSAKLAEQSVTHEYAYARLGLLLGLVCILGGLILFLRGVSGSTAWTAAVLGLESTLSDAGPGAVLFVVGMIVVFVTRPSVIMKKVKG